MRRLAELALLLALSGGLSVASLDDRINQKQQVSSEQDGLDQRASSSLRANLESDLAATLREKGAAEEETVSSSVTVVGRTTSDSPPTPAPSPCPRVRIGTPCLVNEDCRPCDQPEYLERVCGRVAPDKYFGMCVPSWTQREGQLCADYNAMGDELTPYMYAFTCEWGVACVQESSGLSVCRRPATPGAAGAPCGPSYAGVVNVTHACNEGLVCSKNDACVAAPA